MEVDVEVLDVNDEEARALLLSIDPLAALAQTQEQLHKRLMELTPADTEELRTIWEESAWAALEDGPDAPLPKEAEWVEKFLVLITCRDERHQCELLTRFREDGLECKPLLT
jgi:hypothetical protein